MPSTPQRGRILIVDDDELVRNVLTRVLRRAYEVESVSCISTARERLERAPGFTLVLCDEFLGAELGSELHACLRGAGDPAFEQMLFMTGERDADHLRALGGGHILYKPFETRELVSVVSARIEQVAHRGRREC